MQTNQLISSHIKTILKITSPETNDSKKKKSKKIPNHQFGFVTNMLFCNNSQTNPQN